MSGEEGSGSLETQVNFADLDLDYDLSAVNQALRGWNPSQHESEEQYQINSSKEGYLASEPRPNEPYNLDLKETYRAIFYDLGYDLLAEELAEDEDSEFVDYFPDIKVETVSKYQLPPGVLGMADPSTKRAFIRKDLYKEVKDAVKEHEVTHNLHPEWSELRVLLETNTLHLDRTPGY